VHPLCIVGEHGEASGLLSLVGWPAYPRASLCRYAFLRSGVTFSTVPGGAK
jgi:hypothetical protein